MTCNVLHQNYKTLTHFEKKTTHDDETERGDEISLVLKKILLREDRGILLCLLTRSLGGFDHGFGYSAMIGGNKLRKA